MKEPRYISDSFGRKIKLSNRTVTVRNPNHPHNQMHTIGQRAKADVRRLSNAQLDEFIKDRMENLDSLPEVLAMPRGKKIAFVKHCAMSGFVQEFNKAQTKERGVGNE